MFKPVHPFRSVVATEHIEEGDAVRVLWVNYARVAQSLDEGKIRVAKTGGEKGDTIQIFDATYDMMFEVDVV